MQAKNSQIQALRGILCLMIMIFHYTCRYSSIYGINEFFVNAFKYFTFIALMGFLCMNGFFLDGTRDETGFRYFWNKFKRLYPGYFVAITIIFLLQLSGYLGTERSITFRQYLLNIPFLNVVLRTGFVDGAHWYVVFLLMLYFVFAFLKRVEFFQKEGFLILNASAILAVLFVLYVIHKQSSSITIYLNYYFSFSAGLIMKRWQSCKISKKGLIVTGVIMIACMVLSRTVLLSIITVFTLAVMYLGFAGKLKALEHFIPLQYLGDRSYMVYLLHQSIGFMAINFMRGYGVSSVIICTLVAIIIGITLSFVVYWGLSKMKIKC